jgi:hypothetical protein
MKPTKIVNLFGGPGSGKSTIASGIFYELKKQGISVEMPYEFPKEVYWEENHSQISDQLFILANQHRGIVRSYGKVDFIIVDSPILLSSVYRNSYTTDYPSNLYDDHFDEFILNLFNKYDNYNFFLNRTPDYEKTGRFQTEDMSNLIDSKILKILQNHEINHTILNVNDLTVKIIVKKILEKFD